MIRRLAEIAERGDRRLALPRGRQTTHGTAWLATIGLVAGVAVFAIASSRPASQPVPTVEALADSLQAFKQAGARFTAADGARLETAIQTSILAAHERQDSILANQRVILARIAAMEKGIR